RRLHTRSKRDWSSDVCSSDLRGDLQVQSLLPPQLIGGGLILATIGVEQHEFSPTLHDNPALFLVLPGDVVHSHELIFLEEEEHEIGRASCRDSKWIHGGRIAC